MLRSRYGPGSYYTEAEIDAFTLKYDTFASDVYTLDTAGLTLTAGTLTADTITDGTLSITGGEIVLGPFVSNLNIKSEESGIEIRAYEDATNYAYLTWSKTGGYGIVGSVGGGLRLVSATGEISFLNDNLLTTGTLGAGNTTVNTLTVNSTSTINDDMTFAAGKSIDSIHTVKFTSTGGFQSVDNANTFFTMSSTTYAFTVNNRNLLYFSYPGMGPGILTVNINKGDNDFRVSGDNETNLFFADASTDRVGVKTATPTTDFQVNGNTDVVGDLTAGTIQADNGADFSGAVTNITVVKGIVTAAS